ncbi:MAG: GNAT family N-acetyltransferase [Stellaceae bacterium]
MDGLGDRIGPTALCGRGAAAPDDGLAEYERLMAPARARFAASPGVRAVEASRDGIFLEVFLLHFCALGWRMTEPVERWIAAAAAGCAALGLGELAHAFFAHARAEAGHHRMMIADARALALRWNTHRQPPIAVEPLLNAAPSAGVSHYCRVHEDTIAGGSSYAQIAIEYEIERLPLSYGRRLVGRCIDLLGPDILSCLSFVTTHMALDVGHTHANARAMARLLEGCPSTLPALVSAGSAILDAYARFLADCAERAAAVSAGARSRPLAWHLHPPEAAAGSPAWLEDIRALRGSVLFDNGRRPSFRSADGRCRDADPIDLHAYHVLAYDGPILAGCVRVYPLTEDGPLCLAEQIRTRPGLAALFDEPGACRPAAAEIGRWIVHPAYRGKLLAARLAAAAAALTTSLGIGRGLVLCAAGTGDGQDAMLARLGLEPLSPAVACAAFNDAVRVMRCPDPSRLNPWFLRLIAEMSRTLGLTAADHPSL